MTFFALSSNGCPDNINTLMGDAGSINPRWINSVILNHRVDDGREEGHIIPVLAGVFGINLGETAVAPLMVNPLWKNQNDAAFIGRGDEGIIGYAPVKAPPISRAENSNREMN